MSIFSTAIVIYLLLVGHLIFLKRDHDIVNTSFFYMHQHFSSSLTFLTRQGRHLFPVNLTKFESREKLKPSIFHDISSHFTLNIGL